MDVLTESRKRIIEAERLKVLISKIDDADARIELIKIERQEYIKELETLNGADNCIKEIEVPIKKKQDPPSKEKKNSRNKENDTPKRNELTIELVTEEYVNKNISLYEVAKKLNVSIQDLYAFVKKNNLKKRVTKNFVEKSEIRGVNIGAYKTCACCEKEFFVPIVEQWAYKKAIGGQVKWFHCYSCMRAVTKK